MRKVPLAPDVDARTIARGTPGFSGADLANLVNEAALMAARAGKRVVTMFDFEQAKDKVMMGAERRSMVMTEEEKAMTAYHEGGHAIVNIYMPGNDPLHKVTIIPRGRALGVTWALPEKDRLSITKEFLEAKIAMCFGGRIAEQLIYGENHLNSGASSDIKQATGMARAHGHRIRHEREARAAALHRQRGRSVPRPLGDAQRKNVSDATAKLIDEEVRRIVEEGEAKAREILTAHLDELHVLAKALLEYETLSRDEVKDLLAGKPIRQGGDHSGPHKPRSSIPTTGAQPSDAAAGRLRAEARGLISAGPIADQKAPPETAGLFLCVFGRAGDPVRQGRGSAAWWSSECRRRSAASCRKAEWSSAGHAWPSSPSVRLVAPSGMINSPGATASEFTIHLLSAGVISMVRTFSSLSFSRNEKGRPEGIDQGQVLVDHLERAVDVDVIADQVDDDEVDALALQHLAHLLGALAVDPDAAADDAGLWD